MSSRHPQAVVGGEIRRQRKRANRPDEAPAGAEGFTHLFGPDEGRQHANVVPSAAALAAGLIALGQFALRASLDGNVVGLVYAAFGAVMVAGSFVNSYIHDQIDELANYREGIEERQLVLTEIIDELGEDEAVAAGLTEEANRTEAAYAARGRAVADLIRAEQLGLAIANPTTFGTHHAITIDIESDGEDADLEIDHEEEALDVNALLDLDAEVPRTSVGEPSSNGSGK